MRYLFFIMSTVGLLFSCYELDNMDEKNKSDLSPINKAENNDINSETKTSNTDNDIESTNTEFDDMDNAIEFTNTEFVDIDNQVEIPDPALGFEKTNEEAKNYIERPYYYSSIKIRGDYLYAIGNSGNKFIEITKLDNDCNPIWEKKIASMLDEHSTIYSSSFAINSKNEIYIVGSFNGVYDFDFTQGMDSQSSLHFLDDNEHNRGDYFYTDLFITKADTDGNYYWTKTLQKGGFDKAMVLIDNEDNIYISGTYSGTGIDFDFSSDEDRTSYSYSTTGVFLMMLDSNAEYIDTVFTQDFEPRDNIIVKNKKGEILLAGNNGSEYKPKGVIVKLDPNNPSAEKTLRMYADPKDKSTRNLAYHLDGLVIDESDNIFIIGTKYTKYDNASIEYIDTIRPRSGSLIKFDKDLNLIWERAFSGVGNVIFQNLLIDTEENLYITGYYNGTIDFDPSDITYAVSSENNKNFLLKINPDGTFKSFYDFDFGYKEFEITDSLAYVFNSATIDDKNDVFLTQSFNYYENWHNYFKRLP